MFAEEPASKVIDFHPIPSASMQAIELEEAVLGAILLDPAALAQVEGLSIQAFSISSHREIFSVMLQLRSLGLQPDLPTVAFSLAEQGKLKLIGGQSKLASLLDHTVHSAAIKQYACLLQQKYRRRYLRDSISRVAQLAETEADFGSAIEQVQQQLEKIRTVTGDTLSESDTLKLDMASLAAVVTHVTEVLARGLSDWEEQAQLDAVQSTSGISKAAFAQLTASLRCHSDEVMPVDKQQLEQLIEWKNAKLDFHSVIPDMAEDLLHDGQVLNIDPIMLLQYLFPVTLSLTGKKGNLDIGSHRVPAIAWTCIVGESGIGKSRAEGVILAPLRAWQEAEHHRFKTEWSEYKKSQNKKDDMGEAEQPPLPERKFLFEVATIQAVMRRSSEQGENGSVWARDEIAGLFKSLGQFNAKGEGEGLECLLPMWDGTSTPVDRVLQEDSYHIDSSRLSIAGGIQPGIFRQIFTDPEDAQGIQARFLFALPKVQPAKRVKGYCRLSDKLPAFYRWVDTQFPAGNIKLSPTADARYDAVYESMGRQAEAATTPAVRAWMRKLPGQLLRIALALHIIECYHQPNRPRHELQLDTLNRAVELCRYYHATFEVVQQSATDSDAVGSILLKIWDLAATSPAGLAVRDAYRHIKAIQRRAKELGRNVAAYTVELYYQLEKMGKGVVQHNGRTKRFVVGVTDPSTPVVTEVPIPVTQAGKGLSLSPPSGVSPVTQPDFGQVNSAPAADEKTQLLSAAELQPWLDQIAAVSNAQQCRNCLEVLNCLPTPVVEQIWTAASQLLPRFWQVAEGELALGGEQTAARTSDWQTSMDETGNALASESSEHRFSNSNTETSAVQGLQAIGGLTNSPAAAPIAQTQPQRLPTLPEPTAQELAALVLKWVMF